MTRPLGMMFIGTCRMHDPAHVLASDDRFRVRTTPHRLHTTRQTLQFVRHMTGADPYRPEMLHLISDYAAAEIFESGTSRQELLDRLAALRKVWAGVEVFVIEISSRREFVARLPPGPGEEIGATLTVNTFAKRDQERHEAAIRADHAAGTSLPPLEILPEPTTAADILGDMRAIRKALGGRRVIWVSHMRPPPGDPALTLLVQSRSAMADLLRRYAEVLGDGFVDPSETAAILGPKVFFARDGADLDHMTPAAAEAMAEVYARLALGPRDEQPEGARVARSTRSDR